MLILLTLASAAIQAGQRDTARVPNAAVAVHATRAPVIDGRDNDPVWRDAPPITDFTQWQPIEGKKPRFKTEAKVAYDASDLYVFVRAFDPHPDSIMSVLERRDTYGASDKIWIFIDSYHDKRTGYEFGVTPGGVKLDGQLSNGGNEDLAWDAVWDVATTVDSLGWTAEFRIPLSQLRYGTQRVHTFGFTIDRDIYRYNERVSWPLFSPSKADLLSQLGTLEGLANLEVPRRLEAMPYVVTKRASTISHNQFINPNTVSAGGDMKYRVASNVTVDATINPDF
ncbi:MAG TPA: sugar-binding protein, partial [Gemmatimonadaceae bacterium]|nr:sugar-binding protein [Gemmatimonadaceae bacterium]